MLGGSLCAFIGMLVDENAHIKWDEWIIEGQLTFFDPRLQEQADTLSHPTRPSTEYLMASTVRPLKASTHRAHPPHSGSFQSRQQNP